MLDWLFGWLDRPRRNRRRRLLAAPFPLAWQRTVEQLPFYHRLDAAGQSRLRRCLSVLVAEKDWEGCGGLELTDEIKVIIAAQASLLLLHLEHDYFRTVGSILVYPSAYFTEPQHVDDDIVSERPANLGQASWTGPVVLAWDAAMNGARDPHDGRNLVLHEFAHKLDWIDGTADGTPPLGDRDLMRQWVGVMTDEYERLCAAAESGTPTLLDKYGTTNPAEFFAVATECFFEQGVAMRARHPELYEIMRSYYRQDPAERVWR